MNSSDIRIRRELAADVDEVRVVNRLAFARPDEADLVDVIRAAGHSALSLVAVDEDAIVGHILFSAARIEGGGMQLDGTGLAPMAVHPAFQRRGIGSALVLEGLRCLDAIATAFVIVLGHPAFYPRFGFEPASRFQIRPQWAGIPDDAFLIRFLPGSVPPPAGGTAYYLPEFDQAM